MGRTKDMLEQAYLDECPPDTEAELIWTRARVKEEEEQLAREREWAARHPAEWPEWVRISPLLMPAFDFSESRWVGFPEVLADVGSRPSPRHAIQRRDEHRPYAVGNLVWVQQGRTRTVPRPVESPYLTADEAAAYCRRAVKTILNHHSLGNIRSMPGTRPPLFRKEDLDGWLSARRRRRK